MRKRLLLAAGTMAGLVGVGLVVLTMFPWPGVTKANFDRIEDGMSRAEVERLLGGKGESLTRATCWWAADDGSSIVIFFTNDVLRSKHWGPSQEDIPDKIRRWLHLPALPRQQVPAGGFPPETPARDLVDLVAQRSPLPVIAAGRIEVVAESR